MHKTRTKIAHLVEQTAVGEKTSPLMILAKTTLIFVYLLFVKLPSQKKKVEYITL